jgi:hypothetical protein
MNEFSGLAAVSCWGSVKILWWNGDNGLGGLGEMKSKRRASIMRKTALE